MPLCHKHVEWSAQHISFTQENISHYIYLNQMKKRAMYLDNLDISLHASCTLNLYV